MTDRFELRSTGERAWKLVIADEGRYRLGRKSEGNDFAIRDESISRTHAELLFSQGQLTISDLHSTNGTWVNGKKINKGHFLNHQDTVAFGSIHFQVCFHYEMVDWSQAETVNQQKDLIDKQKHEIDQIYKGMSDALKRVARHLLTDLPEKKIAAELGVSYHTIHNQARDVRRQFKVRSRVMLIRQIEHLHELDDGFKPNKGPRRIA